MNASELRARTDLAVELREQYMCIMGKMITAADNRQYHYVVEGDELTAYAKECLIREGYIIDYSKDREERIYIRWS